MRMRLRASARYIALAGVIAIAAVACGSNNGGGTPSASNGGGGSTTPGSTSGGQPTSGGSIVIGAEQWPQCLNPVTDCASASWYLYTIQEFVFPRLGQYSNKTAQEPSALTTEVPSLDNQGITSNPFTVTWHLQPNAVWSDGTPITCDDVAFTWAAILNTTGTYSTYGYDGTGEAAGVSKVECPDPQTVKLDFNKIFVDWFDLFGGATGYILEKSQFSSVPGFPDKPDLKGQMTDSIAFSGGPWTVKSWSQDQAVLVRNDKYWGQKTYLDQVTFVPREDQPTEVSSILSGDVDAIFPQPSNVPFSDQFGNNPNVKAVGGNGNFVEALWFQLDQAPLNNLKVRQAFSYAVDRQAVIQGVIALNNPNAQVNNCGLWIPGQGPWCADPGAFAQYTYNPDKAAQLLTQAGYKDDRANSGFFLDKSGKPLTITISTTAGNVRRATTVSLLQQKALAAGINIQIHTYVPTDLFSNVAPQGQFQIALYAQGPIIDPDVSSDFASNQIPTKANNYSGANWDHWRNTQADALMHSAGQELNVDKRAQETQQLATIMAQDLPMLPVDVLPNIAAWRTDKIAGVDPADVSNPYGFFFAMSTWYAAS
jgi:peptide/nickel transport system substrate-binding protein